MNDIFFILGPQHLPDPSTLLRVVPKRIPPASPRLKGMAEAGVVIGPLWAQQSAWYLVGVQSVFGEFNGKEPFLQAVALAPPGVWMKPIQE